MQNKQTQKPTPVIWRRFANKGYSAFASLKREVSIGVLSIATLGIAAQAEASLSNACMHFTDDSEQEEKELDMDAVTVTGTMAPLTQLQSARIVNVLGRKEIEQAGVQSINDLFKLASGVDVRQRGGYGIQTDISIDGGIFDQITILLNGVNISNPQTGHLAADFPVSISDIERIEILEGAASRVYGGQSFGGAINIVTRKNAGTSVEVGAQGGSFGTVDTDARAGFRLGNTQHFISAGGGRSDGGTKNSEWKKGQAFYQGNYSSKKLDISWQYGFSKKAYGANTFYSANYPDQFERNERHIVSVSAETKGTFHFTPSAYWNRSYDNFELIKGTTTGENFHQADVYGVKAGGHFSWIGGKTAFCADLRQEGILSTNLGKDLDESQYVNVRKEHGIHYTRQDDRTSVSFNLEHNILLSHWTISAGVMANMTTSVDHRFRFYPGMDVAYRPTGNWKVFLSYNKGFRMPTFTELYYKSPTHEGNKGLKPEQNNSMQIGTQYNTKGLTATVRGFYHHGNNMIDWVMYSPTDTYHSASFDLDNLGAQLDAKLSFTELAGRDIWLQNLSLGYTFIHQIRQDDVEVYKSNYALEYLRNKFTASLNHRIWKNLSATWNYRWQERQNGYSPYSILDAKIQWTERKYQVFVQASNLTNHKYFDLGNVEQPGLWIMAGARWKL